MNQPPTVVPTPPPQPAGQRRAQSAAGQTPAGTSDFAIRPLPELRRRLHSSEAGLSASDADAILQAVGVNRIDSARRKRLLTDFIGRFSNPLVMILLGAAAVSAFTGDVPSVLVITLIVLGSVILDVAQERRAENAAESVCGSGSPSPPLRFATARRSTFQPRRLYLATSFCSRPGTSCPAAASFG